MLSVIEVFKKIYEYRNKVFINRILKKFIIIYINRDIKIIKKRKLYFFEINNFINKNLKFLSRTF